ncbi:hypothetical protein FV242_28665 [Methylobacterium sp. WL64]|uniref:hypothetical protein n=1 Tax=Methylobacterium sp. WL64 TaxID=2603894 RepID=UPI0011C8A751|nr:hypothetical protein [Methylobacterium sp. WL64]TXM98445.1 hypothetical protein FV242_28665 [Methylobacterium sp. WL64]
MSDLCAIEDFITEAEHHIRHAEALLADLEAMRSSEGRRLRACMYLTALQRLKRMIETHHPAEAADDAPLPAAILAGPKRPRWWPVPRMAIETGFFRRRAG